MRPAIGTTVYVAVTIGRKTIDVACTVAEHPRGTCLDIDLEALRSALEEAADAHLVEMRAAAAECDCEVRRG